MDKVQRNQEGQSDKKVHKRVILLEDLDGAEDDVLGGASEKLFFGESPMPLSDFLSPGGPGQGGK